MARKPNSSYLLFRSPSVIGGHHGPGAVTISPLNLPDTPEEHTVPLARLMKTEDREPSHLGAGTCGEGFPKDLLNVQKSLASWAYFAAWNAGFKRRGKRPA